MLWIYEFNVKWEQAMARHGYDLHSPPPVNWEYIEDEAYLRDYVRRHL